MQNAYLRSKTENGILKFYWKWNNYRWNTVHSSNNKCFDIRYDFDDSFFIWSSYFQFRQKVIDYSQQILQM